MYKLYIFIALLLLPFVLGSLYLSVQWSILWPALVMVLLVGVGFWLIAGIKRQAVSLLMRFLFYFVYFLSLFVFIFEIALIDFSGRGFTDEVFFHMEWESVRIGINDYFWVLFSFFAFIVAYIIIINRFHKKLPELNARWIISVLIIMSFLWLMPYTGFMRLYDAAVDFQRVDASALNRPRIQQFMDLDLIQNERITPRDRLQVKVNTQPDNLILIYLESFNEGLTHHPQFPALTPQINVLADQFQSFTHLSSSYVTIEGIISSQCGTLLPMNAGNNTFLRSGQLLSKMACLGDVLNQAGYQQYYLGGAVMEFAGKGQFFTSHGYENVWGWEYWQAQGMKQRAGVWGLSDTELFEQAIDVIKATDKTKPFNLTLLTLGTHLPGYPYAECTPYKDSDDDFINAVHCTDQLLGRFIAELDNLKVLDNTVVVIVADHGVFPTPYMKSLFADMVEDRRLIGLTNYRQPLPHVPLSTYDLAPTILDMLNVEHNAKFLFGQSLFSKTKSNQKYATRYQDWDGSNTSLVYNMAGECTEVDKSLSWPLNSCDKKDLLAQTNHLLDFYSDKEPEEILGCEADIEFKSEITKSGRKEVLLINDINHFEHFYHKGYLLNYFNLDTGFFVFELNTDMKITDHQYYKDTEAGADELMRWKQNNDNHLLIILKTSNKEFLQKLSLAPEDQKMDVQVFQFVEKTLESHHAFNLNDSTSLRTCFEND